MTRIHRGPMTGRTVLVTGATGGIGKSTALGLAAMGGTLLAITGRDRDHTEATVREIRAAGGGPDDASVADPSAQAEVRRLAAEVLERLPRLDVQVNNVGGYWNTGTSPPRGGPPPSTTSRRSCSQPPAGPP